MTGIYNYVGTISLQNIDENTRITIITHPLPDVAINLIVQLNRFVANHFSTLFPDHATIRKLYVIFIAISTIFVIIENARMLGESAGYASIRW